MELLSNMDVLRIKYEDLTQAAAAHSSLDNDVAFYANNTTRIHSSQVITKMTFSTADQHFHGDLFL